MKTMYKLTLYGTMISVFASCLKADLTKTIVGDYVGTMVETSDLNVNNPITRNNIKIHVTSIDKTSIQIGVLPDTVAYFPTQAKIFKGNYFAHGHGVARFGNNVNGHLDGSNLIFTYSYSDPGKGILFSFTGHKL